MIFFNVFKSRVKYVFSTCGLHQTQIGTWVFKSVTNGTCGKQINLIDTFLKILLGFLMKRHVTLICDMVHMVLRCHVA
jgi:hypothetical protein